MKNYNFLKIFTLLLLSVVFVQCTSDPVMGPAGADGTDGIDGTDGADGATGTATCVSCHSETHRDPIESTYLMSGHAAAGAVGYAGGRSSCTDCHSNEGFIDLMDGKAGVDRTDQTAISCTTCHEKHGTFDFETDGFDYALRTFDPVILRKVTTDFVFDYQDENGKSTSSNICVQCHQPRKLALVDADELGVKDGKIIIPNRYGPHYGAQGILLEGIFGVEIEGTTDYPTSNPHREGASCVSCHMGAEGTDSDGNLTGTHTLLPTLNSCTSCHGETAAAKVTSLQTEIDGLMTQLEVLFTAEGLLDVDGNLVYNVEYDVVVADAYWNYKYVYYDHSHGVHNPGYSKALLLNSIEALEARQ